MRVLLTNDDGIDSPGLEALIRDIEAKGHEVWIVAPDGERSGMSHSITMKDPIRSRKLGERRFGCSGTPADCVILAYLGIMEEKPDIVVSGINLGPNLGTDITYSGTAAAARQAAFMGIPGVAASLDYYNKPLHFDPVSLFVAENLESFVLLFDGHHFVNVNAPNSPNLDIGIEITHPSYRTYNDRLVRYTAPRGEDYWFWKAAPIQTKEETGSDYDAVRRGNISVSPIHLHPQNNLVDEEYAKAVFRSPTGHPWEGNRAGRDTSL